MQIRPLTLRRAVWATSLALVALAGAAAGAAGKPVPVVNSVTSTVFDTDAFANATLLQGERNPSGSAIYNDGVDGALSRIDSSNNVDWNLDLTSSSRGFFLTIVSASGGAVPGLSSDPVFYSGRVISRCFDPSGSTTNLQSWFGITDDQNCAMRVNFNSGGNSYTLVMSPLYPGTGRASVHCNAFNGSACLDWSIATNNTVSNAGLANLYLQTKRGEQFVATCRLTYRMHVTYP